jgi:hypothetical protein
MEEGERRASQVFVLTPVAAWLQTKWKIRKDFCPEIALFGSNPNRRANAPLVAFL